MTFRTGERIIELPAGLVGTTAGESPADGAARELEEETGFRAARRRPLCNVPPSVGNSL